MADREITYDIEKYEEAAEMLKALAHPTRLRIVEGLMRDECNVSHMIECLGMPQATVSQHLKVLRSARIIKGRKSGLQVCYSVIDDKAREIVKLLFS
ncbi:MAG: metalloregulator ArsR/SmtB family transcription factor [bacterium]|nr:metalloregulator ArsR/SmtB family transcription factor [bacterium]